MSNYNSLKATIDANIKQNSRQEITGQILNSVLNAMVTTLGAGYQFAGVATIATNPGTPDAKVFYIANGKGTYEKFGGLEVTEDDVVVFYWDSSWHKVATGIASQEKLSELESKLNGSDVSKSTDRFYTVKDSMQFNGIINSSGIWDGIDNDNYRHSAIKVKSGDVIRIQGQNATTYCAFFASVEDCLLYKEKHGGLQYMTASNVRQFVVPDGASCFEFSMIDRGRDVSPVLFELNGVDLLKSTQSVLDEIQESALIESVKNQTMNPFAKFSTYPRHTGIINSSCKWAGVGDDNFLHIYIPINSNETIIIDNPNATTYGAFVKDIEIAKDGNEPELSGTFKGVFKDVVNTFIAPQYTKYFVLTVKNNGLGIVYKDIKVEGSSVFYSISDNVNNIISEKCETFDFVVDANGGGDFVSLRDCMVHIGEIIGEYTKGENSPEFVYAENKTNKEFNVRIKQGVYDVRSYFTDEEWSSDTALNRVGLIIPRGVNLIGLGKKRGDVVITCTSETSDEKKSTINIQDDVRIENITFIGNHTRYVVHDDYSYIPYCSKYGSYRHIKNVDFIGKNLLYHIVYGSGTKGGADWTFESCRFINLDDQYCLGIHDRDGEDNIKPENFIFKNCEFINKVGGTNLSFKSLSGMTEENVSLIGCKFKGIRLASNSTSHGKFSINGYGNTKGWKVSFDPDNDVTRNSVPRFSDETIYGFNVGVDIISIGDYVSVDNSGNFFKSSTPTNYISLDNINVGDYGVAKIE